MNRAENANSNNKKSNKFDFRGFDFIKASFYRLPMIHPLPIAMLRSLLIILTTLLVFSGSQAISFAQTHIFNGGGDGFSWDDPANWNVNDVPDQFADIASLAGFTVDLTTGTYSIGSVGESGGGTLNMSGGSLSVVGGTGSGGAESNYAFDININLSGGTFTTLGGAEFRSAGGDFNLSGPGVLNVGGDFRPHTNPYTMTGSDWSINATDYNTIGDTVNWVFDSAGTGSFNITAGNGLKNMQSDTWHFDLNAYDLSNGSSVLLLSSSDTTINDGEPAYTFDFGSNPSITGASVDFANGDFTLNVVPEPSTALLLCSGLALVLAGSRRRRAC